MREPTTNQKNALKKLGELDPNAEVRLDKKTGVPAQVRGTLSGRQRGGKEL